MMLTFVFVALLTAALALPVHKRGLITSNDLTNGPCQPLTVIFARGTTELGNIGSVVGPELDFQLHDHFGSNVAFQGVDYPADIGGYLLGGSADGAATYYSLIELASTKCPNTQIVLSGYSQGAQLVYKAAAQLPTTLASQIRATVLFGNPNNGQPVPNVDNANVRTFCHNGDLICDGQPIVLAPHLTYGVDAPAAADFIAGKVSM